MGGSENCGGLKRLLWILGNINFRLTSLRTPLQVEPQKAREYGVKVKDQELNYKLEKEGMKAEGAQCKGRKKEKRSKNLGLRSN